MLSKLMVMKLSRSSRALLMPEPDGMTDFVNGAAHAAARREIDELRPALPPDA